jgi:hypothetical protein
MPVVGFEPKISAGEQPQTQVLDRAATGTGIVMLIYNSKKAWTGPEGSERLWFPVFKTIGTESW